MQIRMKIKRWQGENEKPTMIALRNQMLLAMIALKTATRVVRHALFYLLRVYLHQARA